MSPNTETARRIEAEIGSRLGELRALANDGSKAARCALVNLGLDVSDIIRSASELQPEAWQEEAEGRVCWPVAFHPKVEVVNDLCAYANGLGLGKHSSMTRWSEAGYQIAAQLFSDRGLMKRVVLKHFAIFDIIQQAAVDAWRAGMEGQEIVTHVLNLPPIEFRSPEVPGNREVTLGAWAVHVLNHGLSSQSPEHVLKNLAQYKEASRALAQADNALRPSLDAYAKKRGNSKHSHRVALADQEASRLEAQAMADIKANGAFGGLTRTDIAATRKKQVAKNLAKAAPYPSEMQNHMEPLMIAWEELAKALRQGREKI